jgi:hypothetical protein
MTPGELAASNAISAERFAQHVLNPVLAVAAKGYPRMTAKEQAEIVAEYTSQPGSAASQAKASLNLALQCVGIAERATASGADEAARAFYREADKAACEGQLILLHLNARIRQLVAGLGGPIE